MPKGTSEEFRRETYMTTMGTFSAAGTFEQDDSDPWLSITRSAGSTYARKLGMQLDYRMGMKGNASSKRVDDYPGPGVAYYSVPRGGRPARLPSPLAPVHALRRVPAGDVAGGAENAGAARSRTGGDGNG